MRIAFVHIANFACALEARRSGASTDVPLIIADQETRKVVLYCSARARSFGVYPGMLLRRALSLCPSGVFIEADPLRYHSCWDEILDALDGISPTVEDGDLGQACLDLTGLTVHYGSETGVGEAIVRLMTEQGHLPTNVGIASGKFPASAAAFVGPPTEVTVVPSGREADFLAPLDVSLIPVSQEVIERLRLLGLDLIGDVASVSLGDLVAQFGREGKRLWQLCNGIDESPLLARPQEEFLQQHMQLEVPVAGIDVLIACARQLLSHLKGPLRGRAIREVLVRARWKQRSRRNSSAVRPSATS